MPATLILTTPDPGLEAAWKKLLHPREPATYARPADLQRELLRPGARVWISDVNDPRARFATGSGTLVVIVGEPHSHPYEQARQNRAARLFLSYDESRVRLGECVGLLEEIAEKNSQLQSALDRSRRSESPFPAVTAPAHSEPVESWDFLESALAHLDDRTRLLDEFRRAARYVLKSSKVRYFFRQLDAFVSDDGDHRCEASHPLVLWLEEHPAALDLNQWNNIEDPTLDAPIRQQLVGWGARLLLPLHTHGHLVGWVALGPRADGAAYRDSDKFRAVLHGRLLERCLERCSQLQDYHQALTHASLRSRYLAGSRLLTRAELATTELPVEVRAVASEALHTGKLVTQPARVPYRYRVQAGPVPEIDGVWAVWEDSAPEIERVNGLLEQHRRELFRSLGLTLSHELSNPLVSLVTFAHLLSRGSTPPLPPGPADGSTPPAGGRPPYGTTLAQEVALTNEIARLKLLNEHATLLGEIATPVAKLVSLNQLLSEVAAERGLTTRFVEEQVELNLDPNLVRFAFSAILDAIAANRPDEGLQHLLLNLRAVGSGPSRLAVITIEGKRLELDGTLPPPAAGTTPNQGRLSVFLAREILRIHGGTLQAGPGIKGTDIQISLGSLRP
jgi:signal transduction histidine kinase